MTDRIEIIDAKVLQIETRTGEMYLVFDPTYCEIKKVFERLDCAGCQILENVHLSPAIVKADNDIQENEDWQLVKVTFEKKCLIYNRYVLFFKHEKWTDYEKEIRKLYDLEGISVKIEIIDIPFLKINRF